MDFEAIRRKYSLLDFCIKQGWEMRASGERHVARCPFHEEDGPSFTVYPDGHFRCYGCGRYGDITTIVAALNQLTVTEAARLLESGKVIPKTDREQQIKPAVKPPYCLSGSDLKRIAAAAHRLAREPELIIDVMGERDEWNMGAIQDLALEGDLGFEDNCYYYPFQGPAVLFGYRHGIKARWKDKGLRWLCGAPNGECWRQSLLRAGTHQIIVTEGEPDAVTAVRFGIEEEDTLIMALAGANIIPRPEPFAGKEIVFCPDTDQAGQGAAQKFVARVKPFARAITVIELPPSAKDLSQWCRTRLEEIIAKWDGAFGPDVPTPIDKVREELFALPGKDF